MKLLFKLLLVVIALNVFVSCGSSSKEATTTYTITKIQGEKDGQTLFLKDNQGECIYHHHQYTEWQLRKSIRR